MSERDIIELGEYVFAVLAWFAALYFWFTARAARRGTNPAPFAVAEVEAQKDFLRADHAVQLRALEIERDQLRASLRSQRGVSDAGDGSTALENASQLSYELEGARRQVETLKKELADSRAKHALQEALAATKKEEAAAAIKRARENAEALHRAEGRITLLTLQLEDSRDESGGGGPSLDKLNAELAAARRTAEEANASRAELETEVERLQTAADAGDGDAAVQAELEAARERIRTLEARLGGLERERGTVARRADARASELQQEAERLAATLEELEEAAARQAEEHESVIGGLRTALAEAEAERGKTDERLRAEFDAEIARLTSALSEANTAGSRQSAATERLTAELAAASQRMENRDAELERLRAALAETEARYQREAAEAKAAFDGELQRVTSLAYEARAAQTRQVAEIERLIDEQANTAKEAESRAIELERLRREAATAAKKGESAAAIQQAREHAEALHRAEERITLLTLQLEDSRDESGGGGPALDKLNAELAAARRAAEEANARRAELETEVERLQVAADAGDGNAAVQTELEAARERGAAEAKAAFDGELQRVTSLADEARTAQTRQAAEIERLIDEQANTAKEVESRAIELERLRREAATASEALAAATRRIEELGHEFARLNAALAETEAVAEEAASRPESAWTKELRHEIERLRTDPGFR